MRTRNKQINLDRAIGAEENASKQEATMRNASIKTPWRLRFAPGAILRKKGIIAMRLRFAPGAILRKKGIIAILAITGIAAALTPIQTQANPWKWLVETIASWGIGKTLDAATTALLRANGGITITDTSPRANAIVNGADWLSNEWTYKYEVQPIVDGPWETETASASMGHQQEPKTARGTKLYGGRMTQAEAVAKLKHKKYSTRWVKFELFDDDGYFDDVYASARTDYINTYVAREFKR